MVERENINMVNPVFDILLDNGFVEHPDGSVSRFWIKGTDTCEVEVFPCSDPSFVRVRFTRNDKPREKVYNNPAPQVLNAIRCSVSNSGFSFEMSWEPKKIAYQPVAKTEQSSNKPNLIFHILLETGFTKHPDGSVSRSWENGTDTCRVEVFSRASFVIVRITRNDRTREKVYNGKTGWEIYNAICNLVANYGFAM